MAFKRKSNRKGKKTYKRKAAPKKSTWTWGGVAETAAKALSIGLKLADAVNTEYKEVEGNHSLNPDYTGITFDYTDLISQGVGKAQRVGDSLKLQRLTMRGMIINNQAIGATGTFSAPEQFRMILYHDKTNSVPAADLLETAGSTFVIFSPKKESLKYNTKILWDRTIKVIPQTTAYCTQFKVNLPLNWHANYVAATAQCTTGALKLAVYSQSSAASNATILASYTVSYTDN